MNLDRFNYDRIEGLYDVGRPFSYEEEMMMQLEEEEEQMRALELRCECCDIPIYSDEESYFEDEEYEDVFIHDHPECLAAYEEKEGTKKAALTARL